MHPVGNDWRVSRRYWDFFINQLTTTQEIDVENLLIQFKNSWKTEFDGTKRTCAMIFEDLVFGQHMAPSQAQQIVESIRHHVIQKNWTGARPVLRIHLKESK